ncbi:hypothetical protein KY289_031118 [Solanum tuberosum]|nr:hypothetical protein KY284_030792 [Solanum tuberosum]KAH0653440.1 hypothetical protein KY289_031118 [Solanum tuberosum]
MAHTSNTTISSCLLIIVQLFFMLPAKTNAKIPAIIVFGDSSVDSGNNNHIQTVARSNFMPYGRDFAGGRPTGRFSNGRITTDFISEAAGLKQIVPAYLDPAYNMSDFAVGVCFASAGTGYDNATADVLGVIPLWKQVEYYKEYQKKLRAYLGDTKANEVISEALYATSLGTNDFLENYYTMPQRRSQYTIDQFQIYLVGIAKNFITNLYNLGARKISLGGLPPMGCMPLERTRNLGNGNECMESYNLVAVNFNEKLNGLVMELNKELPEIQVVLSNPYEPMLQMIKKPSSYGFEVASIACCATGLFEMGYACDRYNLFTCKDANKYIFWDAFHPTERTDRIIADHVVKTALSKFLA